jgi:hypothetical protein
MSNTTSRVARLGSIWAAVAAVSLVAVPSANAAATFYTTVPTNATGVTTVKSKHTGHGTLQVRKGKYNGKTYLWGRISGPDSTLNSGWDLRFHVASSSMPGSPTNCDPIKDTGSTTKDIDTTTYTSAVVLKSGCHYYAVADKREGTGYYSTEYYTP